MDKQLIVDKEEFRQYAEKVSDALLEFYKVLKEDAPKHVCVHIEILREHGHYPVNELSISAKYPFIGSGLDFYETSKLSGKSLKGISGQARLSDHQKLLQL